MFIDEPYFMTNNSWYYYDYDEKKYKLTYEAPKEAVESYDEYYKTIEMIKKIKG